MKILQLIPNISGGGAERLAVDLSNQLSIDHSVILLTLYDARDEDLFRDKISPKVKTQSLGKKIGFDWRTIPKLYRAIKSINPDIVHNHLRSFNYLIPSIPFMGDIPVIHTVHNDAFEECRSSKIRKIREQFFKMKNIIPVTISSESAKSFEKAYTNIDHALICNGRRFPEESDSFDGIETEVEKLCNSKDTRVFVNIGRQEVQKNQLMLVKAFNRLVYEDDAKAILFIIGGGRDNEASREIQQKLKEAEEEHAQIHVLGEKPNATDYLHAADFFCLSSLYEGMPITLIEAFATGTIPICTPVGGIPEMVSELDVSLLSENASVENYYEVLKRGYFLEEQKLVELKERAKLHFKKQYSISHCANKYESLYKKLLNLC